MSDLQPGHCQLQPNDLPATATSADIQRLETAINNLRLAMAHNTVILDRVLEFIIFNGTGGPEELLKEFTGVLKPVGGGEPK